MNRSEESGAVPQGAEQPIEQLVVEIARELYDRFVMGGWEPQDAYPSIREWLGLTNLAEPAAQPSAAPKQRNI